MGTRLTKGMTLESARGLSQAERDKWIALLTESVLPKIEEKKRIRDRHEAGDVSLFLKIRARLTGKQYCLMPGVYCDVRIWGDGKEFTSVVECDLDLLEKGARKLVRTLEKASEQQ